MQNSIRVPVRIRDVTAGAQWLTPGNDFRQTYAFAGSRVAKGRL
jgi:hypothetical protein